MRSNFDASTSSRLIAFLRVRSFLSAHLTSTKKYESNRQIDFVGQWFFVISHRYGACRTAYDELRPTNDGCCDILFFHDRFVFVSLCVIHRETWTTEIFNYLRKLAAWWVIERKVCERTNRRSVRWIIARFAGFAKWNSRFVKFSFYQENAFPKDKRTSF